MKCKDCKFWNRTTEISTSGTCRKYCPKMFMGTKDESKGYQEYSTVVTSQIGTYWPRTAENACCGEFEALEKKENRNERIK